MLTNPFIEKMFIQAQAYEESDQLNQASELIIEYLRTRRKDLEPYERNVTFIIFNRNLEEKMEINKKVVQLSNSEDISKTAHSRLLEDFQESIRTEAVGTANLYIDVLEKEVISRASSQINKAFYLVHRGDYALKACSIVEKEDRYKYEEKYKDSFKKVLAIVGEVEMSLLKMYVIHKIAVYREEINDNKSEIAEMLQETYKEAQDKISTFSSFELNEIQDMLELLLNEINRLMLEAQEK